MANVILAHSLIRSFKEVNPDKTAITGISWGGYLTNIVAGLDHRFQAAVPVYGCGFLHRNSAWLGAFSRMNEQQKTKWVTLWDPSQYVGSAQMPMLLVNGGTDFAYPPDSHAQTFALIQAPKTLHFVPQLRHGHIFDKPRCIETFIAHHLKEGPPLAELQALKLSKEQVTLNVNSERKLKSAALHFSTEALPGDPRNRKWQTLPAQVKGKQVLSQLPPAEAVIWFLTVTDQEGNTVTTPLRF